MFKQVITLLLLFTFTVQTFHQAFIVIGFYSNQEYIAKTKCENRYRPQMKCGGKCVLAKKLQKEAKEDQNHPERKMENKNEVYSPVALFSLPVKHSGTPSPHFNSYNSGIPVDIADDFFHPPAA